MMGRAVDVRRLGGRRESIARTHARSGDRIAISTYLGSGDAFEREMIVVAFASAAQNAGDFEAATEAMRSGRLPVA